MMKKCTNKKINDFVNSIGLVTIMNDMNESRTCFANGYRASILEKDDGTFYIACFDVNGYLCYNLPEKNDTYQCDTELQAMAVIERISRTPAYLGEIAKMDLDWID